MPLIDYLLLTPLDEEWRRVRSVLCPDPKNITSRPIEAITYYLWKQPVDQPPHMVGDYLIVAASMGRKTPGEAHAGVFSTHCVNRWSPARVVLLGIAGSLEPNRLQLGDVVVSDEIYGYEVGDAEGSDIHFRPTFNQIGALDLDRVRALRDDPIDYVNWQKECQNAAGTVGLPEVHRVPELHLETTASGNYVVKSVEFGKKLRNEINFKISAVEMEARGLHQALYMSGKCTDPIMIRGISDYADKNKAELEKNTKDAWRAFAAANAARLLSALWRRGPVPPISPAYVLDLTMGPHTRFRQEDVPNIEFKNIGAQDIAFPNLLKRSHPTPELYLKVTALYKSGDYATGFHGQCIVECPGRQAISGQMLPSGGISFVLPASQWGLHVEMLLSFPASVSEITVNCRDEFQRCCNTTITWQSS